MDLYQDKSKLDEMMNIINGESSLYYILTPLTIA